MVQDSSFGSADMNTALNLLVLSMLNDVKKVCFGKCFGTKFGEVMNKSEQICLAKCMDRMYVSLFVFITVIRYEAHTILSQAAAEAAKNIGKSP
ncbi:zinc binding protein [Babesia ovis]|uniref:Mitochondrial import inner membrane translocase subunit n=1 Tax=Babesia ovis TaxID=5869 RepID=A0A9W5WUY5_BABOV|nr:zinc binding protein [Babesia ovis]